MKSGGRERVIFGECERGVVVVVVVMVVVMMINIAVGAAALPKVAPQRI